MSGFHIGAMLAALALNGAASGGAYRWVDAQGGVHYGDQPPSGAVTESVQPPLPPGAGEEQKELREISRQRSIQEAEKVKQQEQVREQKQREATRKAVCTDSQAQRERLERPRQLVTFPDGSARRLDEEERQARIRETEARIAESCIHAP